MQSADVPVCSTVLLPSPSRPTQKLEYVVADVQLAVGWIQLAETLVYRPLIALYPDQFELVL